MNRQGWQIVLQQTVFPDYRQEVFALLREHWGRRFRILAGDVAFDSSTRTRPSSEPIVSRVKNRFLFRRRILWQHGTIRALVAADVAILELNPRILSVWVVLLCRRLLKRNTVLWGHAWSRRGREARINHIRDYMRAFADTFLVYTDTQKQELATRAPKARICVAPNGIYRRSHLIRAAGTWTFTPSNIVYVGRLVPAKKPLLLVDAYRIALEDGLPRDCRLVVAGDGPLRKEIELACSQDAALGRNVLLQGHVHPKEVGDIYRQAIVSVSPGYVGLSATQSFSFGVPMIIARDEPHAPEIEATQEGHNSIFAPSDDPVALAHAVRTVINDRRRWRRRRKKIMHDCASRYSAEAMAQGIIDAVTLR